jgi:Tol biopolymer transport system component
VTPQLVIALAAAISAVTWLSCGGDGGDKGDVVGTLPSSERPEIAFFTTHPEHSEGIYDLAISDAEGNRMNVLTGGSIEGSVWPQLFTRVSWSPDGERIAFAGGPGPLDATVEDQIDIYVMQADGSQDEQLTELGDAADPVWSPDGDTIVFTRLRSPEGEPFRADLWSIDVDGGEPTRLTEATDWQVDRPGSFTPDGSQLAFTRTTYEPGPVSLEETSAIEIIDADGSDQRTLIERGFDPAFSPDGEQVAFASDRDENGELCYGDRCRLAGELDVASADGSDPMRLTETREFNEARPSWLPEGSRIAYQRGKDFQNAEVMSIFEVNADGSCGREILRGSGGGPWYASPAWRPSEPRVGGGRLQC